jgi:uncharacterized membrane protein
MRVKAAKATNRRKIIEWRSHEPSRLETFSDAVFAFAVTLIIVSLEVPKNFGDLVETLKGIPSFAICFTLLFLIWNDQNLFFRYFGLKDGLTVALNATLLFVVLIYVYPLKFLFNVAFFGNHYTQNGKVMEMIGDTEAPTLFLIYGIGYAITNLLFYLMYSVAIKNRDKLGLKAIEVFEARTVGKIYLICCFIGLISILLAYTLPARFISFSGFFYMIIGPSYFTWFGYRNKKRKKQFGNTELKFD